MKPNVNGWEETVFFYNLSRRTMTIVVDDIVTVLGPFKDEDDASTAALKFCLAQQVVPQAHLWLKTSRTVLH
ncbi:hypothetical protein QO002_005392 [Pararhizobium capsulatum DSM 1112]|uniref:Uncharacterized protein n=1 Tax=Pararhizobium capsulatum DSM 1112 TaxID=1121113 RepID=A0ABU0BY46_9HYPH|nr:hypothetical protein [Pararhizobium capsulatum DSM 1112]